MYTVTNQLNGKFTWKIKTRWMGCFFWTETQLWHKMRLQLGNNTDRKMFPLYSKKIHIISCQLKKFIANSSKEKTWLEILQDKSLFDEEWSKFIKLHTAHSSLQKQHRERGEKKESAWGRGEGETEGFFNSEPGCNSKYKLSQNNTAKFSLFCQQR